MASDNGKKVLFVEVINPAKFMRETELREGTRSLVRAYFKEQDIYGSLNDDEIDGLMLAYITQPTATLVLLHAPHMADSEHGLVGYFLLHLWEQSFGEKVASVSHLYLVPSARMKGVPRRLLEYGLEWARQHGAHEARMELSEDFLQNHQGLGKMLQNAGFSQLSRVFSSDITAAGEADEQAN